MQQKKFVLENSKIKFKKNLGSSKRYDGGCQHFRFV